MRADRKINPLLNIKYSHRALKWWPKKNACKNILIKIVKILAFSISRSYFIHFNISLYNTPNIKGSIILPLHLNIFFNSFFMFSINYHVSCGVDLSPAKNLHASLFTCTKLYLAINWTFSNSHTPTINQTSK